VRSVLRRHESQITSVCSSALSAWIWIGTAPAPLQIRGSRATVSRRSMPEVPFMDG
jgi:hypothetical protein